MTINFILLLISILFFQIWSFSCTLSTISPFTGFLLFAFLFFIYWMLYRAVKKARTVSRRNAEFAAMKEQARLRQDQDFLIQESLKRTDNFRNRPKSSWRFTAVTWKIRSIRGLLPVFPISPLIFSRSVFIPYAVTI